ncbi:taurine ABC transporter substrate-binding protein [Rothia sp. HMSC069C03]|uniref:taurine ABC transporter substrate-binding protein n=1 Tax=Rothia sp. HMSC069C03 TaxID=1739283 RepID=UPI0008B51BA0|nr:taurine ABC transporter substrate-binding protein [Rothia sp. HMSC069C03]OFL21420.1 taurine ABC transporter substrate-binding protein [Rothia sp. HMSC069C03]
MNFLLILLALLISGIAVLSVVALSGERAVPGAAFFSGVGRDGLGTFDRVEDFGFIAPLVGAPEDNKVLENAPAAEAAASITESADANVAAAEPVRRSAVPLSDDAESTLSAHDFVEKRKNPQAEGALSVAEGS